MQATSTGIVVEVKHIPQCRCVDLEIKMNE